MSRNQVLTKEQKERRNSLARERRKKAAQERLEAGQVPMPNFDQERVAKLIVELVEQQGIVSSSEVRYRIDSHKHNWKKIGMKIIYRICDELVAMGKIGKFTEGRFVKFRRVSAGALDKIFGMVKVDDVAPARYFSVEELHSRIGTQPRRNSKSSYGIRSTFSDAYGWDAAW